jgi:ribulose-5-phosphate 4-epimerase/fuculose-1-phosphate aldolase
VIHFEIKNILKFIIMKYKINKVSDCSDLLNIADNLAEEIARKGNELVSQDSNSNFVLNIIDIESPKAFRRKTQEEMVVSITLIREPVEDLKALCYVALVKSISNMLFCISLTGGNELQKAYSITPEVGFLEFKYDPSAIYTYMYPVISSHFVLRNKLYDNLLFNSDETIHEVEELKAYGKELGSLGVLPAPFPLANFLEKDLIDQLYRLYQIKGLSYGNLSIRNVSYNLWNISYWMTARGVDKSNLKGFGKDILLVKGFDKDNGEMQVSVPQVFDPRIRVSVDAIEHFMIYREFPGVGAIVHVHAWIDDVMCTTQTYPCGTFELAENVVELLKKTSSPERTEVGLKNHGLTITGPDIKDIFSRIRGRLKIKVPMLN